MRLSFESRICAWKFTSMLSNIEVLALVFFFLALFRFYSVHCVDSYQKLWGLPSNSVDWTVEISLLMLNLLLLWTELWYVDDIGYFLWMTFLLPIQLHLEIGLNCYLEFLGCRLLPSRALEYSVMLSLLIVLLLNKYRVLWVYELTVLWILFYNIHGIHIYTQVMMLKVIANLVA
jgi:hypothetical protein